MEISLDQLTSFFSHLRAIRKSPTEWLRGLFKSGLKALFTTDWASMMAAATKEQAKRDTATQAPEAEKPQATKPSSAPVVKTPEPQAAPKPAIVADVKSPAPRQSLRAVSANTAAPEEPANHAAPVKPLTASERLDATIREIEAEAAHTGEMPSGLDTKEMTPQQASKHLAAEIRRISAETETPANPHAAPVKPLTAQERLDATIREIEAEALLEPTRPENAGRFRARGRDI